MTERDLDEGLPMGYALCDEQYLIEVVCEYCGGEAVGRYPVVGMEIALCEKCLDKYEEFYLKARPSITRRDPLTNKIATVRVKHSLELLEKKPRIAWVNELTTWFIEEGGKLSLIHI